MAGKLTDKHLVDRCKSAVEVIQIDNGILRDGTKIAEIFLAEPDGAMASVFGKHRQAMGSANNEPRGVHEARTFFKQGTGAISICVCGLVLYVTHHLPGKFFQGAGQPNGFDGKNRKMNSAAVAGASFSTGNLISVPILNSTTGFINPGHQTLIFYDRL